MWEPKASKPRWERAGFAAGFHGGGTFHSPLRPRFSRGASGGPGFVAPFAGGAETVGKPDTFPLELVNGAVVGQPVQQGGGQCASPKTLVHCANGRFDVTVSEPFS